jgi:tetratricopeptide (TPR) repeat protein
MPTITETLETAVQYHRAGNLRQAEQLYHAALQVDPNHPVVVCLLGSLARQQGKNEQAIDLLRRATLLKPDYIEAHNNLGNALAVQGKLEEAAGSFQMAIHLRPDYAEAHNNLGNVLTDLKKLDEAVLSYQQAVRLKPDFGEAYCNLGLVVQEQGKLNEALSCFRQAMQHRPDFRKTYEKLRAKLAAEGTLDEGVAGVDQALRVGPDTAVGQVRAGMFFWDQGDVAGALRCFEEAVRMQPNYGEAHCNMGLALRRQGKLEEAMASYQQALRLLPEWADAHNGLGVVYYDLGEFPEALACYEQTLRLKPHHANARVNRSLIWLLQGELEKAWPEYEYRWKLGKAGGLPAGQTGMRPFKQPLWGGSPLKGKTILLYAEQGLGDTIHFARYAPLLKQRGGKVIVECQKQLDLLLCRCPGIDKLVVQGSILPDFDVQAPLACLPGILHTNLETISANIPYLFADPERVEHWHRELSRIPGFKIGISWQGNVHHPLDSVRSFPLSHFASLAEIPGVSLISLQKGNGHDQIKATADRFAVVDLGPNLDEKGAFHDTAAVMMNLDLVICCDTAIGHLAGALGVPTWLPVSLVPDWRWLLKGQESRWYPTIRLFRQKERGNWKAVFEEMADSFRCISRYRQPT